MRAATKAAEEQTKKITADRDQLTQKLKESQVRESEIRQQIQEQAEKKLQKELTDQRVTLEKDRDTRLLKQQAEMNRERESYQKKLKLVEQQLQKKTANELGDGAEIDLYEELRDSLPDQVRRVQKGEAGADIIIEVLHKVHSCGRIIIDSKNRKSWQNTYVTKLRRDQLEASAEHAILATTVFPAGKKEMCIESEDVIVVNPARVVQIVQILRQAMVLMHIRGLSLKERATKMSKLYGLITSDQYTRKFNEAGRLSQEILDLDVEEKKAHDIVWKKRGTTATRMKNVLREIETDIAAVIESDDSDDPLAAHDVTQPKAAAAVGNSEENHAWNRR